MPIKLAPAPQANLSVLEKGLKDLSSTLGRLGLAARIGETVLSVPVFTVSLADAASDSWPEKVRQVAWRYLIPSSQGFGAAADIGLEVGGLPPSLGSLSEGKVVEALRAAVGFARKLVEHGDQSYEMRILEIPALYAAAVWLKGNDDMFVPYLDGRSTGATSTEVYRGYVEHIVQLAERKLAGSRVRP